VLDEGTAAPDFTLPDQHGTLVSLAGFRGRWLVLWWFPKAFTEG
jgi:peroxiredoxin Q/BCP